MFMCRRAAFCCTNSSNSVSLLLFQSLSMVSAHHSDFFILRPFLQEKAKRPNERSSRDREETVCPGRAAAGSTPTDPKFLAAQRSSSRGGATTSIAQQFNLL